MADIHMRFPKGKAKTLTLSYDDGVEQDQKLIEILDCYGLKGTFNLNSGLYAAEGTCYLSGQIHRRMSERQATELYSNSGHEVAVHGSTHPWLEQLPVPMAMKELLQDRETLEKQFGHLIRGMAYPYGTYNDAVVECVRAAGLVYARTVISSHTFCLPGDWLRLEATCHHDDPRLMELAHTFVEEKPLWAPWMFYLWGHSYEFEANDNWQVIEQFAALTGGKEDIWYATNIQIYDYVQAYQRLEFSADGSVVRNPSMIEVWLEKDGNLYALPSGAETILEK